MTITLTPACPLCGLRYASKPLLELHIREDHRPRRRAQPAPTDVAGTQASPRRHPAGCQPSRRTAPTSRSSRTAKEVTAMPATRRPRPGQVLTVRRRLLRALRHVNDELIRASQAIIRSARAPQPRPRIQAPAASGTDPGTAAGRADQAA